jgi:dihydrofolate reductase
MVFENLHLITAFSKNQVIGNDKNSIPWHIPQDFKHFKEMTYNHIIIMGNKTFESLPNGPLKGRLHIVLTNSPKENTQNVMYVKKEELFEMIERNPDKKMFVIGGSSIYKLLFPYCKKMYITYIHQEIEGSVYFPYGLEEILKMDNIKIVHRSKLHTHDHFDFEFLELEDSTWLLR